MKAIAQSTGRTIAQIKTDANATGDLGIVAEQSRSSQCMIFQPARLTVQSVFSKLKAIAQMSGHSVSICNIKLMSCTRDISPHLLNFLCGAGYFSNIWDACMQHEIQYTK